MEPRAESGASGLGGATCPQCGRARAGAFRYCLGCGHDYEASPPVSPPTGPTATSAAPLAPTAAPEPAAAPEPVVQPEPTPAAALPAAHEPTPAAALPAAHEPTPSPAIAATVPAAAIGGAEPQPGAIARLVDQRRVGVLAGAVVVLAVAVVVLALTIGPLGSGSASPTPGIPAVGTGVAASDVTTVHALEWFGGFTFESGTLSDGRPRTTGRDATGASRISLIGPVDDLHELSLEVPGHRVDRLAQFAALWFPEATEFVAAAGQRATGETERQQFGATEVSVRVRPDAESSVTISKRP